MSSSQMIKSNPGRSDSFTFDTTAILSQIFSFATQSTSITNQAVIVSKPSLKSLITSLFESFINHSGTIN